MSDVRQLPAGLAVAPVWRRAAAGLIDVTAAVAGLAVVGGAAFGASELGPRRLRALSRRQLLSRAAEASDRTGASPSSTELLILGAFLALKLDEKNRVGFGARVIGIRRVDVRTGGPITARAALIGHLVMSCQQFAVKQILAPISKRSRSKRMNPEFQAELRELKRLHADDPKALEEAMARLYRDHNFNPCTSCLWPVLIITAARAFPMFLSPLRQGLPDRVAGIVTVVDQATPEAVGQRL